MVDYDIMGNVTGFDSVTTPLKSSEADKIAKATQARADFSNVDPRRQDKGNNSKKPIARNQHL